VLHKLSLDWEGDVAAGEGGLSVGLLAGGVNVAQRLLVLLAGVGVPPQAVVGMAEAAALQTCLWKDIIRKETTTKYTTQDNARPSIDVWLNDIHRSHPPSN
jgi:hypothetical protein